MLETGSTCPRTTQQYRRERAIVMSPLTKTRSKQPILRTPADLRGFWKLFAAVLIVLAPLSVMIGRGIMPYWTTDSSLSIVEKTLAHQDLVSMMGWTGIVTGPVLLLGVLAVAYVARRGSPVLATLGAGLSFLAWCMGSATVDLDYLVITLGQNGFDAHSITQLADLLQNTALATVTGIIWLIGHIVGMVLIGIAVVRAGLVSWWVGIALIISQPMHFISAVIIPSRLLDLTLGWGLTTLGCAVVALAVARMTNDQWDLAPQVRPVSR